MHEDTWKREIEEIFSHRELKIIIEETRKLFTQICQNIDWEQERVAYWLSCAYRHDTVNKTPFFPVLLLYAVCENIQCTPEEERRFMEYAVEYIHGSRGMLEEKLRNGWLEQHKEAFAAEHQVVADLYQQVETELYGYYSEEAGLSKKEDGEDSFGTLQEETDPSFADDQDFRGSPSAAYRKGGTTRTKTRKKTKVKKVESREDGSFQGHGDIPSEQTVVKKKHGAAGVFLGILAGILAGAALGSGSTAVLLSNRFPYHNPFDVVQTQESETQPSQADESGSQSPQKETPAPSSGQVPSGSFGESSPESRDAGTGESQAGPETPSESSAENGAEGNAGSQGQESASSESSVN